MLNQIIRRAYYLNKHLEAPLLKEREEYLQYLAGKGYYRETLKITAEYLLRIVEFLQLEEEKHVTIEDIEKAAAAWAKSKHHHPMKRSFSKSGGKKFILLSIDWLKRINRLEYLPEEQVPLFNRLFERRHALIRHTSAPLLKERLLYLQHWADLEARDGTLRRVAQYQLLIMDLLHFHTVRPISIHVIEKAALKWAVNKKVGWWNNTFSKFSKQRFIYDAVSWFKILGCLTEDPEPIIPFQEYRDKYLKYMIQEQGLAEETVCSRSWLLRNFLTNLNDRVKTFAAILPSTIDDVLAKKYDKDGLSRRSLQSYASVVRSFLRYAENQQWCLKGIAASIKAPRVYRHETLPSSDVDLRSTCITGLAQAYLGTDDKELLSIFYNLFADEEEDSDIRTEYFVGMIQLHGLTSIQILNKNRNQVIMSFEDVHFDEFEKEISEIRRIV